VHVRVLVLCMCACVRMVCMWGCQSGYAMGVISAQIVLNANAHRHIAIASASVDAISASIYNLTRGCHWL
jgi:hypothetical protein